VILAADCARCGVGVSGTVDQVAAWLKAHASLVVAPVPIVAPMLVQGGDGEPHEIEVRHVTPLD